MQEIYWNQFLMTGKIEDYLSYRAEEDIIKEKPVTDEEQIQLQNDRNRKSIEHSRKKEKCESDSIDGNGTCSSAGGRI